MPTQKRTSARSLPPSTERNRRLRKRRREGIEIGGLPVQLFGYELDEMLERGLLTRETRLDREAVAMAIEEILRRWSNRR